MTRFTLAGLVVLLLAGMAAVAVARRLGLTGRRGSALVSVVAHWLAAYVLWTFAGGLLRHYGVLGVYEASWFAGVAVLGGLWHYRAQAAGDRDRGLTVFVGAQLAWLLVVLVQNGLLTRW